MAERLFLAAVFLDHGWGLLSPRESMRERVAHVFAIAPRGRNFIGVAEILAAVGLVLAGLTGRLPQLTPLAGIGLVVVIIGAIIFHICRRELPNIVFNVVLLLLALFVAYGRWVVLPLG